MIAHGRVVLLVMTDGRREYIEKAIASAEANLHGPITRRIIHDDSGDDDYRDWLVGRFDDYEVIFHPMGRQGFGGAIRNAWRFLTGVSEEHVFHLEDDFVFNRPLSLYPMMELLENLPGLSQVALRRQPWNDNEAAAGGIVELHPDAYTEHSCCPEHIWLEHRQFFTTNPSLYPRTLCSRGWPAGEHSEGHFSLELLEDPYVKCAFWGGRDSGEWVEHIGHTRAGTGY